MDEQFFKKINHICCQIVHTGCEKLFLYPFGYNAMEIYEFLRLRTNFEIICVDENLNKECDGIISFNDMVSLENWKDSKSKKTSMVMLTSSNPVCYNELRLKVKKYIKKEFIMDLFPRHPLIYHKDARIGTLTAVAENIYHQGINGSVAEAGVYQGNFSKYINMLFPDRKLYLFDTFKGFEQKQLDLDMDNNKQTDDWIELLKDTSEELVISKMEYPEMVEIKKGLFPGTARELNDNFAFVNLDMDIYKPTYEGLKFFWEKLAPGGIIFVHDFGRWDGIDRAVEKFCKEIHTGYVPLNDGATVVLAKEIY